MSTSLQSLDAVADRLATLDGRWLALALALQLGNLAFRTIAWRTILAAAYPSERIRLVDVGAAYTAGVALNAWVPARGGEALKIGILRMRIPGSSVTGLAASNVVFVVVDALMAAALFLTAWALGVVPAVPRPSWEMILVGLAALTVALALWRVLPRVRERVREGTAILTTPRLYLSRVVPVQLAAWACRLGVAFSLLAAFQLPATLPLAALVVVAGGLSTLTPTPGGAGTQQLLVVYALQQTASAASALSFSIGMQVGVTAVNTLVGLAGLALVFQTLRPSAIRAATRAARNPSA